MVKISKHIEIVRSDTKGLSSMSQESCDLIFAVLTRHFTDVGVTVVNKLSDLETLEASRPDLVFLGMEFIPVNPAIGWSDPNKIWLSDFFDDHEIAYTGSGQIAHELERNKNLAKQRVLDAGLKTAAFCVIKQNQPFGKNDIVLTFPMFIKPTNRGGGLGVDSDSVVHDFDQLRAKVRSITEGLRSDALIEEYLPGREFSVAVLKDEYSDGFLAMPLELIAPPDKDGARLLSSRVKSSNAEQAIGVTDRIIKSRVNALALNVFNALGARDYGRIDIRLDRSGVPHFLEANLIPSLISGYGSFPKACVLNIGLEHEQMIVRIVKLGLARNANNLEDIFEPDMAGGSAFAAGNIGFEPA